jgi:outer membrane biosynthesis protein TonB
MSGKTSFEAPSQGGVRKWLLIGGGALIALLGAWLLYRMLTDINGIAVKPAPPTVVDMLPPPPPPPPPPLPQERPPEPQEKAVADPVQQPAPDKPAPAPMQIDGPAQAGGDAYGMTAGSGGGMGAPAATGLCTGLNCGGSKAGVAGTDRFWGRNIANALEDYLQSSRKVNVDSFVGEFSIVVSSSGALTQAEVLRSTGDGKLDQTILALLESARGLKPPSASIRMPQRVKIGRKRI